MKSLVIKVMLAPHTYPEIFNKENDFAHIQSFPFQLPKLVSDNLIIYRNPGKVSIHTDDMIFPVTHTQVLIRNKINKMTVHGYVRVYIDMLALLQAKDYVACTDLRYPPMLVSECANQFKTEENLSVELFKWIFERQKTEDSLIWKQQTCHHLQ
jgi:hypothetical protein